MMANKVHDWDSFTPQGHVSDFPSRAQIQVRSEDPLVFFVPPVHTEKREESQIGPLLHKTLYVFYDR